MFKKILIYNSGGGLGDSIQIFNLILSLQNHFKSSDFLYLSAHENHFKNKLKEFNIEINKLNLELKYFGFRLWHFFLTKKKFKNLGIENFDIIIDLQSKLRNTIVLKQIPHKHFYSSTLNFRFCTSKGNYLFKNHIKNLSIFLKDEIEEKVYNLNNLSKEYLLEAERLLPNNNYIGFSMTQGNAYRKKSWSIDNFITLALKLSSLNKIPVFFINENKELISKIKEKIPNALFPEENSKLSCPALVTALASRLMQAITIDNGVMHMMNLAKIPMIVLFGPTSAEKFAPKNDMVKILDSKKIYNSENINTIKIEDIEKFILSS